MTTETALTRMKTPSHSCPAYVVARIRKLLTAKGWPLQRVSGRYQPFGGGTEAGTEGFHVSKVGCSKHVTVHYAPAFSPGNRPALSCGFAKERVAEAVSYLRSLGYRIDERGWIECDAYDTCDR